MLVIVNPHATSVSERLRDLVVYALRGRYRVEAVDTESRQHATEICREAAGKHYDVVVAFGGDGTVNEAANGLAGSPTPLSCLPGGATNVYCRLLGIPGEIVDATEHLLRIADGWHPRPVDLGRVNDRRFTYSAGVGLDASVVRNVDARPRLKARFGAYFFTSQALGTFAFRYVARPPHLEVHAAGQRLEGVTLVVQNAATYTYFNNRPIVIGDGAALDGGTFTASVLKRANPLDVPTIMWRALFGRARLSRHRQVDALPGLEHLTVQERDGRPVPLQVDGDYIGDVAEADFGLEPGALTVVS